MVRDETMLRHSQQADKPLIVGRERGEILRSVSLEFLVRCKDLKLSAISTLGTVWRDCVAEGLRLIFTPVGVEDD